MKIALLLIEEHILDIRYAFSAVLTKPTPVVYVNVSQGHSENKEFLSCRYKVNNIDVAGFFRANCSPFLMCICFRRSMGKTALELKLRYRFWFLSAYKRIVLQTQKI
ncbi:unnamed protein product [Caretta caretta]